MSTNASPQSTESLAGLRVLLVEDTPALARTYKGFLREEEFDVDHVETGGAAKESIKSGNYDLVLLDLRLPDISGEDVMAWMRENGIDLPVIVITAQGSVGVAVEAMRYGAVDFLMKPFTEDRLILSIRSHLDHNRFLKSATAAPAAAPEAAAPAAKPVAPSPEADGEGFCGFIGESVPMQAAYRLIRSASTSNATVFITGESGSGKEVCAQAIHTTSARASKELVALNCAAIPGELMESEIFGHIKGAFTGATTDKIGAAQLADGGTLFLDEICEMSPHLQTKLLRFIQTGTFNPVGQANAIKVDTRFICATNRNPLDEVAAGRFREDLYYRLHVIPVHMPALRERGEDVIRIATKFLRDYAAEEGKDLHDFAEDARNALLAYNWPGNVRQLQNIIRHAVVFGEGTELKASMLRAPIGHAVEIAPPPTAPRQTPQQPISATQSDLTPPDPNDLNALAAFIRPLEDVERETIEQAVSLCAGDVRKAAVFLGVSPATIYRKQKSWREETT